MIINYDLILDVIINSLIPLTRKSVENGNKIFGAAIIKKSDYSVEIIGTNNENINPIFHGEISTINNFFNKKNIKNPNKYLFISSHEPCSLCLSAITWSGFDNFLYFFPYEDTKNKFNIPHDLNILKEVFNINEGKYNVSNSYWKSYSILKEIDKIRGKDKLKILKKVDFITKNYDEFSQIYQNFKDNNKIPLK
tara:strand:- start:641 stop:1222 length:582 start_codon:yes stop_codon:yes gene_type:complete